MQSLTEEPVQPPTSAVPSTAFCDFVDVSMCVSVQTYVFLLRGCLPLWLCILNVYAYSVKGYVKRGCRCACIVHVSVSYLQDAALILAAPTELTFNYQTSKML